MTVRWHCATGMLMYRRSRVETKEKRGGVGEARAADSGSEERKT